MVQNKHIAELRHQAEGYREEYERTKTFYIGNSIDGRGEVHSAAPVNKFYLELAVEYDRRADEEQKWDDYFMSLSTTHQMVDSRKLLLTYAILGQGLRELEREAH